MTKMMFALWAADHAALRSEPVHNSLRDLHVRHLQLNLDDDLVAPGTMRLSTGDPINAIVGVWVDPDFYLPPLLDLLRSHATRVEGWLVDERRRLEPPSVPDGQPAEALANVALIRRPDDLTRDEWLERWMVDHTAVAIRTQATFGYVQNVVQAALTPDAPIVSALVEELFPVAAMTDMHAFYGSGGDDAELKRRITELMASVGRIGADRDIDLVPSGRYCYAL